jgi:hypothetical protein
MDISPYTPSFSHTDWIDNRDRVQAGGDNGFNARFHDLEAEFALLAAHLNPLVDALSKPLVKLTLAPMLMAYVNQGETAPRQPWVQGIDHVRKASSQQEAHGTMGLNLPAGARIQSLLVTGSQPSGTLTIVLQRHRFDNTASSEQVVTASQLGQPFSPPAGSPELAVVEDDYRYYLTADLVGATATDLVQIFCVQLTYQ